MRRRFTRFLTPRTQVAAGGDDPLILTFASVENPVSGALKHGSRDGGDFWNDMKVATTGKCIETFPNDVAYDDGVAVWDRTAGTRHYVKGTVHLAGGYTAPNSHELLLFGMATMTSSTLALYECLMDQNASYIQFNRWDTTPYTYTLDGFQTTISGSPSGLGVNAHDDVIAMYTEMNGSFPRFTFTKNGGAPFWVCEDQTVGRFSTGNPGFGTFYRSLSPSGVVPESYCWKHIEMGSW